MVATSFAPVPPDPQAEPQVVPARNGKPSLRIGDACVHSVYDPEREAQAWAGGLTREDAATDTLWVVFGGGLGYHVRALSESSAGRILVYEPDERVSEFREQAGVLEASESVQVVGSLEALRDAFRNGYMEADTTRVVSVPAYARLYAGLFDEMRDRLAAYVQELKADCITYISFGAEWLITTIENMPSMISHRTVAELVGKAHGWPAVVVSPGPSLEKNLHQLAEHQDRFCVICPSQTLKALSSAGIQADLVVVTDSQNLDYHFDGCPPDSYGNLVLAAKCHPAVVDLPAERRFFYHLPFNTLARSFFELLSDRPCELQTGHSVSNTAFSLAVLMDADPVVLMGQDLAFSGKQMYCRQAIDGGQELEFAPDGTAVSMARFDSKLKLADPAQREGLRRRLAAPQSVVWVQGRDGGRVPTAPGLKAMLTWFEREAESIAGTRRLLNATEGGAFIRGMEHVSFLEVAEALESSQPARLETRLGPSQVHSPEDTRRVFAGLHRMAAGMASVTRIARKCDRLAQRAWKASGQDREALVGLQKNDKKLGRLLGQFPAVDALVQDAMRKYRALGDPDEDDLVQNLERSRLLYRATAEAGRTLGEALRRAAKEGVDP